MSILDLYAYARSLAYPRCVIAPHRSIAPGECGWLLFLSTASADELATVSARIARHEARLAHEQQKATVQV
jgi:hypothetical protein